MSESHDSVDIAGYQPVLEALVGDGVEFVLVAGHAVNAWGRIMVEILEVHAITSIAEAVYPPSFTNQDFQKSLQNGLSAAQLKSLDFHPGDPVFYIKEWVTKNRFGPIDLKGVEGQGTEDPKSVFVDHCLVKFNNKIYDPSYETGPYASVLKWEDESVAAYGATVKVAAKGSPPEDATQEFDWVWKDDPAGTQETSSAPAQGPNSAPTEGQDQDDDESSGE